MQQSVTSRARQCNTGGALKLLNTQGDHSGHTPAISTRMSKHTQTPESTLFGDLAEAELVAAAKRGCGAAFGELTLRTRDLCLRIASGILGDGDEAADEVQNAFWKAYVGLAAFEGQSRFSTWVVRILINCCMSKLRSEKARVVPFDTVFEMDSAFTPLRALDDDCPEERLARKELQALIRSELGKLPVILREPLEHHYLADLSLDEMAAQLGISLAAAKSRLSRGHKYLRERMRLHCGHRGAATLLGSAA